LGEEYRLWSSSLCNNNNNNNNNNILRQKLNRDQEIYNTYK
jgi:hypothetical protein